MTFQAIDFKQPEHFVAVDDREYYLTQPYELKWRKGKAQFKLIIPAHLNTDFASTPKWGKLLGFGHDGPWRGATVGHDFLYMTQGFSRFRDLCEGAYWVKPDGSDEWQPGITHWKRAEIDKLFLYFMKAGGTSWWRRSVMYRAVRLFGKAAWES